MTKRKVQGMGPLEEPDVMKLSDRQAAIQRNLERCPRFERCNRNQCPLDAELELRYGGVACLWMQEGEGKPRPSNTGKGMITYVTGAQMPDDLLRYVPAQNVGRLNAASKARWDTLSKSHRSAKSPRGHTERETGENLCAGGGG